MRVSAGLLLLSALLALSVQANHTVEKRQTKYICGKEPYQFTSDVPCHVYTLCPNGGIKLFIGCSTNLQCQIHHPESVCIDQCCCTLPHISGSTLPWVFDDSGTEPNHCLIFSVVLFVVLLTL